VKPKRTIEPAKHDGLENKREAFYSALVQAWFATRLERNRTIVTLSSAGIGLLVTLMTATKIVSSLQIVFYGFGVVSFLIAIVYCIQIFGRNAKLIEATLSDPKHSLTLSRWDRIAVVAFITGVISSGAAGIISAEQHLPNAEQPTMQNDKNKQAIVKPSADTLQRSFTGLQALHPDNLAKPSAAAAQGSQGESKQTTPAVVVPTKKPN